MKPTEEILELVREIKNELRYINDITTPILNENYPKQSHAFSEGCENAIYVDISNISSSINILKFIIEQIKEQLPELPKEKSFMDYINKLKE